MRIQLDATGSPEQVSAEVENSIRQQLGPTATDAEKDAADGVLMSIETSLATFRAVDAVRVQLALSLTVDRV